MEDDAVLYLGQSIHSSFFADRFHGYRPMQFFSQVRAPESFTHSIDTRNPRKDRITPVPRPPTTSPTKTRRDAHPSHRSWTRRSSAMFLLHVLHLTVPQLR